MIISGNKNIAAIIANKKEVVVVKVGLTTVWQRSTSCFGSGYWNNDKPWINDDPWISV